MRFVRVGGVDDPRYSVEFLFDSDVSCSITVYFGCTEEATSRGVRWETTDFKKSDVDQFRNNGLKRKQQFRYASIIGAQPETFHYKPGAGQVFSQPTIRWGPSEIISSHQTHTQTTLYPTGALANRISQVVPGIEAEVIPLVIVCQAEEGDGQSPLQLKNTILTTNNSTI